MSKPNMKEWLMKNWIFSVCAPSAPNLVGAYCLHPQEEGAISLQSDLAAANLEDINIL